MTTTKFIDTVYARVFSVSDLDHAAEDVASWRVYGVTAVVSRPSNC
jgi:hypothetical protein